MSEKFVPSTDMVRSGYANDPVGEYHDPVNSASRERALGRAFDRWLESVRRQASEAAWDEGARTGYRLYEERPAVVLRRNPYRTKETPDAG
ncbi:hypothetical protein [Leucobacter massiliensis]|nr:hypothetical protein [Leucobacter massiliensis]